MKLIKLNIVSPHDGQQTNPAYLNSDAIEALLPVADGDDLEDSLGKCVITLRSSTDQQLLSQETAEQIIELIRLAMPL